MIMQCLIAATASSVIVANLWVQLIIQQRIIYNYIEAERHYTKVSTARHSANN